MVNQSSEHDDHRAVTLDHHFPEILVSVRKWTLCSNKPRNILILRRRGLQSRDTSPGSNGNQIIIQIRIKYEHLKTKKQKTDRNETGIDVALSRRPIIFARIEHNPIFVNCV